LTKSTDSAVVILFNYRQRFANILSCRLRVAFLSSRSAVVAGCELRNQHRNGN
jgi:hypothetical protein